MAQKGQHYSFYVSLTAPTAPTAVGEYEAVGEVVNINIDGQRVVIEAASWDDGDDDNVLAGRRSRTLSGEARFDVAVDDGQEAILDAFESASGTIYFLLTPTNSTEALRHGSGVLTSTSERYPLDDVIAFNFEARLNSYTRGVKS